MTCALRPSYSTVGSGTANGVSPSLLPLLVMFSVTFHTFYLTAGALTWKLHHNFNWLPVRLACQEAWPGLEALCYLLAGLLDDRGQHELGRLIVHDDMAIIDIGRDGILVLLLVGSACRVGCRLVGQDAAGVPAAVKCRLRQAARLCNVLDDATARQLRQMRLAGSPLFPSTTAQRLWERRVKRDRVDREKERERE